MSADSVSLNLIVKNPDEDSYLVEQAIEGNREAFRELFMKNVSKIYSLCLRNSSDTYLAEELTQEVFIKAWEKLKTFHFESKFSSWLHSIAVNQFLMFKRAEKRSLRKVEEYNKGSNTKDSKNYDTKIDIEKAISKLPQQSKTVLILHDIEGYKHNEISEMMKIEMGTSKSHLHRARKLLREELLK